MFVDSSTKRTKVLKCFFLFFWWKWYSLFVHQCTDFPPFLRCSRCQSPPVLALKFAQGTSHPLRQIFRIEKEKAFIIHSMRLHIQTRSHLSVAQSWVPFQKNKLIFSRLKKVSHFMERQRFCKVKGFVQHYTLGRDHGRPPRKPSSLGTSGSTDCASQGMLGGEKHFTFLKQNKTPEHLSLAQTQICWHLAADRCKHLKTK